MKTNEKYQYTNALIEIKSKLDLLEVLRKDLIYAIDLIHDLDKKL